MPNWQKAVKEFYRVLKPNGLAVSAVWSTLEEVMEHYRHYYFDTLRSGSVRGSTAIAGCKPALCSEQRLVFAWLAVYVAAAQSLMRHRVVCVHTLPVVYRVKASYHHVWCVY
eukprot:19860-Heterococcus_DN1.PRE.5